MGHRDHRADQIPLLRVAGDAGDEGAVDLDPVREELGQDRQGGLARAEIVQRDRHAGLSQPQQRLAGGGEVPHGEGLRELELEDLSGQAPRVQRPQDVLDEPRRLPLPGGDVDRDAYRVQPRFAPPHGIIERAV